MPQSFNSDGNPGTNEGDNSQGTSFGQGAGADNAGNNDVKKDNSSNNTDFAVLQKRVNDSQEFISTLKTEREGDRQTIQQLQEELAKRPTLEELTEHINSSASATTVDSADLISKTVDAVTSSLSAKEEAKVQDANFQSVSATLTSAFGADKVDAEVARLAQENDMSFDEVVVLAKRSPKAALKLLGLTGKESTASPDRNTGSLNTQGVTNSNQGQPATSGNIMTYRTDKDRVAYMQQKMKDAGL
jgi:hypothetical protein